MEFVHEKYQTETEIVSFILAILSLTTYEFDIKYDIQARKY
jgi:hypothetical protein